MKLSIVLRLAILTYYFNRSKQYEIKTTKIDGQYINIATTAEFKWNKGADIEAIFNAARKSKLNAQACSGTFWFIRVRPGRKTVTYKTDENIFPLTEKV